MIVGMPEMQARLVWPDGSRQRCYSPSLVLAEHLQVGVGYPVDDLVRRARAALTEGSERVRAKYGMPCARAAASIADVERHAARCADSGDARGLVVVEGLDRL